MTKDPMLDKVFLKELFNQKKRYIYAKVTTYDNDENPIESIEGRVTQGSINLDGRSSVRRSCSLTIMSSLDLRLEDELNWTLNTKIKVEIGMQNFIDETYDDIIWFNMGFYCISNFSFVKNTSGCTVSLQGKDKMCLLNGDLGGEIYAAVDFGTEYIIDKTTGAVTPRQIPIEDIIREAVYEYAKEPYQNIDVEDIPKFGLFLLDYLGGTPFYILVDIRNVGEAADFLFNQTVYVQKGNNWVETQLDKIPEDKLNNIGSFINTQSWEGLAHIKLDPNSPDTYYACRIESGETCGYEVTDLTYPKESEEDNSLSIGVGGTITQVLDKIVEFLGDYEYFFDVNGKFVFRKKNRTIDTNDWSEIDTNTTGIGVDYDLEPSETNWNFAEEELVTQYNSSQKMGDIRNDFSIWGNKQTAETEVPIHLRYAIDFKPQFYRSIDMSSVEIKKYVELYPEYKDAFEQVDGDYIAGAYSPIVSKIYYSKDCPFKDQIDNEKRRPSEPVYEVDWREIIYQMAKDYLKFKHFDQFLSRLDQNNYVKAEDRYLYPKGKTKYEQYYVDLEANWRSLYAPRSQYIDDSGEMTLVTKDEVDINRPVYIKDRWIMYDLNEPYLPSVGPTPESHEGWEMQGMQRFELIDDHDPQSLGGVYTIFIKNPMNLNLRQYLDYRRTSEPEPASGVQYLYNSLSCYADDKGPNNQLRFTNPYYFFMKQWDFKTQLRLTSRSNLSNRGKPQFYMSGMGIFCDNYTNNSSTHFEWFLDFNSRGFVPFDQLMLKASPNSVFTSRSVAKSDRFNLIIPVKTLTYLDGGKTKLDEAEAQMLSFYNDPHSDPSNLSYFQSDEFLDFYKLFKVETVDIYDSSKTYEVGDKCYYLTIPPSYGAAFEDDPPSYFTSKNTYYPGQEVIFTIFDPNYPRIPHVKEIRWYKCTKQTIPKETMITNRLQWTQIERHDTLFECTTQATGAWDRKKWTTYENLQSNQEYYMLETVQSVSSNAWKPLNKYIQVVPDYKGIKYYDSGELVYRLSVMKYLTNNFNAATDENKQFISRVTSLEDYENYGKDKTYHFIVDYGDSEQWNENEQQWITASFPKVVKKEYTDLNYTEDDGIILSSQMMKKPYQDIIKNCIRGVQYHIDSGPEPDPSNNGFKYHSDVFYFLKKNENYLPNSNLDYPWGIDQNQSGWTNSDPLNYKYNRTTHLGNQTPFSLEFGTESVVNNLSEVYYMADIGISGHVNYEPAIGDHYIDSWIIKYKVVPIEYYQKVPTYQFEQFANSDWNEEALNNPEQMIFWFDFLHSEKSAQISKYGADKIMDRAKSESKDEVSAICFRDVLNIIYDFGESSKQLIADATEAQQAIFNVPENLKSNFIVSDKYKSCKDVLDEWMQKYTQQNDAVSISATPIQFLEPNQRILTPDGEYVINSISFPLTYNGMMNINATKVVEKLQ